MRIIKNPGRAMDRCRCSLCETRIRRERNQRIAEAVDPLFIKGVKIAIELDHNP